MNNSKLSSTLIAGAVALIITLSGGLISAWTQIVQNSTTIDRYKEDLSLLRGDIRRLSDKVDRLIERS